MSLLCCLINDCSTQGFHPGTLWVANYDQLVASFERSYLSPEAQLAYFTAPRTRQSASTYNYPWISWRRWVILFISITGRMLPWGTPISCGFGSENFFFFFVFRRSGLLRSVLWRWGVYYICQDLWGFWLCHMAMMCHKLFLGKKTNQIFFFDKCFFD